MDSGVVIRAMEACASRQLATLRFNFRGVGASTGKHDDGRGERDDVRAAVGELRRRLPAGAPVALAGYSFGAAVAAGVAAQTPVAGLLLIAPPLRLTSLEPPAAVTGPVLIVIGVEDQYCPASALEPIREAMPQTMITVIDGADHFFFGGFDGGVEGVFRGESGGSVGPVVCSANSRPPPSPPPTARSSATAPRSRPGGRSRRGPTASPLATDPRRRGRRHSDAASGRRSGSAARSSG